MINIINNNIKHYILAHPIVCEGYVNNAHHTLFCKWVIILNNTGIVRIYDLKSNYSLAEIPVINNLNLITNKLVLSNN